MTNLHHKPRLHHIDRLRGFSLFGILAANLLIFQYGLFGKEDMTYPLGFIDRLTGMFIGLFIEGSFYPIFAFLFGFSLILLKDAVDSKQTHRFRWVFLRRMSLLLLFGIVHTFLVWDGDILFSYAICGFTLLLFYNRHPIILITTSLLLFSWTILLTTNDAAPAMLHPTADYVTQENRILSSGTYEEIVTLRLEGQPFEQNDEHMGLFFGIGTLPLISLFLFGMYVAKKRWIHHLERYQEKLIPLFIGTFLGGLVVKSVPFITKDERWILLQDVVGGPLVAAGYVFLFLWLSSSQKAEKWLHPFAAVGQLSLTNYLTQSLVFTTIFYGYGLGLFGQLGPFIGFILTILFFALQLAASNWWLNYFTTGPVEWLWRVVTYLRFPTWVRKK
ncbi:DUF418 domain-containing protein [Bacillus sp. CGMCC 1.16541]|uniref:DUF418 domain-containing protein n=1 Tax=Bacillus sp. CGMCC 1.16541 TaxID=2185143 RepID=UPI00194F2993|nr:DUF418 domain-containing protein [Bacillus sp. CGMCC 1.16541]